MKKQGATVGFYGSDLVKRMPLAHRARQYHYFTSEKHFAAQYANRSAKPLRDPQKSGADAVPKLARLFYVRGLTKMKDWDAAPKDRAYRTRSDIPRHAVRQEKGADRYSEEILTGLQERIEQKFNVSLSTSEIERTLLNDVESDSDNDDFPDQ